MKRIGIITFQKIGNLGAELQAYALQQALLRLGYDAENIDYLYYKHPRFRSSRKSRPTHSISWVTRLKSVLFPILVRFRSWRHIGLSRRRSAMFAEFDKKIRMSREYRCIDDLYKEPPKYDVYLVGSDQVWNPRTNTNIEPYFLSFAPKGARCASYAASIGSSTLSPAVFMKFKSLLERFSAVGVREDSAVNLIRGMSLGVEIRQNLDPTLLLDASEWQNVSIKPESIERHCGDGAYVLLYDLIKSQETVDLANRLSVQKGWQLVRVGDGAYGPSEFVWLVAHAGMVVTNSFHGTAFSIIHKKEFLTVIPRGMTNASRIESLLKVVGLDSRLIHAEALFKDDHTISDLGVIDWASVSRLLEIERGESMNFLKRVIESPSPRVKPKLPIGCYAVWSAAEKVRADSTSGGMFRLLAGVIIKRGGVVFGAAFSDDFRTVTHRAAETFEELVPLMKSKYVWSDPSVAYKQAISYLKSGREVLFTGTPCQVAAMKSLARGMDGKLWTMDLVCHGTPRPEIFRSYVEWLERKLDDTIIDYQFRNKEDGWNFPRVIAKCKNGTIYSRILRNDPFYLGFALDVTLREACFKCPYANLERTADFTIADCWRVAASNPEWDDGKGTSLLLISTPKAERLWRDVFRQNGVHGGEYDLELAQLRNMPLMQRVQKPYHWKLAKDLFERTQSFDSVAKLCFRRRMFIVASLKRSVKYVFWRFLKKHQ